MKFLLLMCLLHTAVLFSSVANAANVVCNGERHAADFTIQDTFSTNPAFASRKTFQLKDGSEVILADLKFISEGIDTSMISEFSKNCTTQVQETKNRLNNEIGIIWSFTCKSGVSGKFSLDVPSLGLGNLNIHLANGQDMPLAYTNCKLVE